MRHTVACETSCPMARNSAASLGVLLQVQRKGDMGSSSRRG